jgi:peptide/nickel transport system substrate-binding protein
MNRILRPLLLLAAAAFAAVAVAQPSTLVLGVLSSPRTFNPWVSNDSPSWTAMDMMYSGLVRFDASGAPSPDLAASWTVSDDGRTYVFTLQDAAAWHDGTPVTADDVVFTFRTILAPAVNSIWASRFGQIEGAAAYRAGESDELPGVVAVDERTVRFELTAPLAAFLPLLSVQTAIMPAHLLGDVAPEALAESDFWLAPVGSGAWRFVQYESGQYIEYEANPAYHLGAPGFDRLFQRIGTADTLLVQLQRGEVDVAPVPITELELVERMEDVTLLQLPTSIVQALNLNLDRPALADLRVRQAIAHAIDKQMLVDIVISGASVPTDTPVAAPDWALSDDLVRYPYDPERARELLAEAGWDPATVLTLRYPTGNRGRELSAPVIQQALAAVGIQVELSISDFATLTADAVAGDFDLLLLANAIVGDPDYISSQFTSTTIPPNGVNYMRYRNERVDELLALGKVTPRIEDRAPIYAEFQRIITEELPRVHLYIDPEIYGISDRLEGLDPGNGLGLLRNLYWNLHEWTPAGR